MRTTEEPECKIEMFPCDLAVKGNVAFSSVF
jgi:hypothetical protein